MTLKYGILLVRCLSKCQILACRKHRSTEFHLIFWQILNTKETRPNFDKNRYQKHGTLNINKDVWKRQQGIFSRSVDGMNKGLVFVVSVHPMPFAVPMKGLNEKLGLSKHTEHRSAAVTPAIGVRL